MFIVSVGFETGKRNLFIDFMNVRMRRRTTPYEILVIGKVKYALYIIVEKITRIKIFPDTKSQENIV